ncbi:MAG: methyltransferase domain-containing protein [Panacagrimonas sp.]
MKSVKMHVLGKRVSPLLADLRCPKCHAVKLEEKGEGLVCRSCRAAYPVMNGVPRLLSVDSQLDAARELHSKTGDAMRQEYTAPTPTRRSLKKRLLGVLRPPEVMLNSNPDLQAPHTKALFEGAGPGMRVLNVGGGPRRYSEHEVSVNIDAFPNVDMVADAHNLPFADASFDAVFSVAVLEHVYNPETVAAEMMRVLRPGGVLYSEVPFFFFFHGYPNDFRRYTREGMRRLFGGLNELEIGIIIGPMSAMLQAGNIALNMLVPSRLAPLRSGLSGAYRWLTFPLKYLDIPLVRHHPDAHLLAAGFYAIGRKPAAAAEESVPPGLVPALHRDAA